jgi:hypothetical protein
MDSYNIVNLTLLGLCALGAVALIAALVIGLSGLRPNAFRRPPPDPRWWE